MKDRETGPLPEHASKGACPIVYVGNARDYHAMDWFRSIQKICPDRDITFLTDLINSEGHRTLIESSDKLVHLVNLDRFLLPRQGHLGNLWRNFVKFLALPLQAICLRRYYRHHRNSIYHAHTMYYMVLCTIARVPFIGTPQGSEILVRPRRSRVYRFFATRALRASLDLTVDSTAMQQAIASMSGRSATLIQNGIDVAALAPLRNINAKRFRICSPRGMTPLYRILSILEARNSACPAQPLTLCYPFLDSDYHKTARDLSRSYDEDLGRLQKPDLYNILSTCLLVVSIPESDSSPRSVYEAIFAGCAVAVSPNPYITALPPCMRNRMTVVNLDEKDWLPRALEFAYRCTSTPYEPSAEALDTFDQLRSAQLLARRLY